MAHFAKLDSDNIVTQIKVVANAAILKADGTESELKGKQLLNQLHGASIWKQCSYNGNFRKNFPAIGYKYDSTRDAFIPPKPFDSWTLNETTCQWEAPVSYPSNAQPHEIWYWDEDTLTWKNDI